MIQLKWTLNKFISFKKAFNIAFETSQEYFWFDGHQFLTSYAKYLIEYLEPQFKES